MVALATAMEMEMEMGMGTTIEDLKADEAHRYKPVW
jgi:hypothetical protein